MPANATYDVVIVGAGIAGAIMAKELGTQGKRVLILESGPIDRDNRKAFHGTYLTATGKLPETPYPPYADDPASEAAPRATTAMTFGWPTLNDKDRPKRIAALNEKSYLTYQASSDLPFLSTYERLAGGTTWHWLGTCLRLVPNDFRMKSAYGVLVDWPLDIADLFDDYARAEDEIGVSADIADQRALQPYLGEQFPPGYEYPMARIPQSVSDTRLGEDIAGLTVDGQPLEMTCTPQGRNSQYRNDRPACQGNSSCIPICPIQAKYDAQVTLRAAEATQNVSTLTQAVACDLTVGADGRISSVSYLKYTGEPGNYAVSREQVTAKIVVLAAHAVETVKLLLMSNGRRGVANSSGQVGRNLMDHLCYLGWGLSTRQYFPYRGPRSGSGVESLRDGPFRKKRSAWRIDVGNVGWEWADDDPATSLRDFVHGSNKSQLNPDGDKLYGRALIDRLNDFNTRMVRLCYLVEQEPQETNRITLSERYTDGLGLPRPEVNYSISHSEYTLRGFVSAQTTTERIFKQIGRNYTRFIDDVGLPAVAFDMDGKHYDINLYGAGHIMGTYRMGATAADSVVGSNLRSWDHKNLYLLGSGTFPTVGTGNPTLTIAALTYRASRSVLKDLAGL